MKNKKPIVTIDWKRAKFAIAGLLVGIVLVIFIFLFFFTRL
jgi:hypothetical protein